MILQSLHQYYKRLQEDDAKKIAPEGFASQRIGFALQLSTDGQVLDVLDLRAHAEKGNKLVPIFMMLPNLGKKRAAGIDPNFLWDGTPYVLGKDEKGKPERTAQCHEAFKALHRKLLEGSTRPEAKALLAFLESWDPEKAESLPHWEELLSSNMVFRVGNFYLHEIQEVRDAWVNHSETDEGDSGICLVTGDTTDIATLHPVVKGVYGAQPMGAALSSYNLAAFESYGKKQNLNAPVGKYAAFTYTTALNHLISMKKQSLILGEATVICWAERPCRLEDELMAYLTEPQPQKETDIASAQERASVLRRLGQGLSVEKAWPDLEQDVEMHVLALAPNVSRLSVRFYLQGSAEQFLRKINAYFQELALDRRFEDEPEFPSVWQIARAVLGPHKKTKDISRLGEDVLRAILSGGYYPEYLLPMCIQRLRSGDSLNSIRAGLIKAMLIRNHDCEVTMSLNPDHPSPAYHLGRLFALLLGVQRKAIGPTINADIRDKYYGSASSTPAVVFPMLLRNAQNHIKKGSAFGYDKMIRDILDKITDHFPSHLNLVQQGEFALGYYHQRATKAVQQDLEETASSETNVSEPVTDKGA